MSLTALELGQIDDVRSHLLVFSKPEGAQEDISFCRGVTQVSGGVECVARTRCKRLRYSHGLTDGTREETIVQNIPFSL